MKKLLSAVLLTVVPAMLLGQETSKITSSLFGMMEARSIGPSVMGGRITAIDAVNNDPRKLYIGTAGGGVWKTSTGGATFKPVFDKYCQSIGSLTI
ncbi:MAG: hypothetical protein ACKOA1_01755, partial [Bacteroidota bacterium]